MYTQAVGFILRLAAHRAEAASWSRYQGTKHGLLDPNLTNNPQKGLKRREIEITEGNFQLCTCKFGTYIVNFKNGRFRKTGKKSERSHIRFL